FGNQIKAKYLTLEPLCDQEFQDYCQELDGAALFALPEPQATLATKDEAEHLEEEGLDQAPLIRLASFPEITPSPMLEINVEGELTYLNPAAVSIFPELPLMGMQHPILQGLLSLVKESDNHIFVREVTVADKMFEQSIHYISESDLIRCCVFDITERMQAEAELRKRDRLLQSVAEATTQLLENSGETAINLALAILGEAAGADRIAICKNHPHTETGHVASSMKFEWTRDSIEAIRHRPHRQEQCYSLPHLKRWYHMLTDEMAIRSLAQDLPEVERAVLAQDNILAILVVPIVVNDLFWGFIELDNCTREDHWSGQEESILFAMAASVGAALQRQDKEEIIRHQAFHDALTNLPNRVLFNDRLNLALAAAQRNDYSLAVMFMDLDRFKLINDTLGHSIGDELLEEVAQRLQDCLREGDTVARWGGDEFTVLLPQIQSINDATNTAYRILDALKGAFLIRKHELFITTSIGISIYPEDGQAAEILLQNADVALYRSKEYGRGSCQLYNPTMNASDQFVLENSLRRALEREELLLYYQPKVNIVTGHIVGLEALIRWEHPEMGLVSPATFIPIAEETGLIVEMGEWVLRTACEQAVLWQRQGFEPLSVAINLSARQFYQPNLVEIVAQVLETTGLAANQLELEITESIAVKNMEFAQSILYQFQELGVSIAMDDFGTGYSSLSYLKQLPFHTLKIDQAFIRDLKPNSKDFEIINAMIALGKGLNLKVVAEGVDSHEQLELLRDLNCEIVQGFLFSRPLTVENTTHILQANWLQRQLSNSTLASLLTSEKLTPLSTMN
ncbi:MAG: EAL domain-containing protein, partial [Acaryochloridaceae cyanobacterium SU_2_1]|nr:EAL domain-containing protein [Acaryochloridaceae cyanobacterium SU_2_1]